MKNRLHIGTSLSGKRFTLPSDIITQSVAILAKRRVGKSYSSDVLAEELLDRPQQTVIIDPTGVHWGLRSSPDGKEPRFPIVVIGGKHGDLPLQQGGGEMLARAIIEQKFSAIIDTSLLRKGETLRFLDGFLGAVYHLNEDPLHLILDEVDYYCPQMTKNPQEAITTSHVDDLVRRGGVKGIGVTMLTQRSSVVNKNILTQCEVLIAMRLVHPLDIKAVMDWVGVHGDAKQAAAMTASLPALPVGTAWVWWPSEDIFERISIRHKTTFDSGRTPKPGDKAIAPKVMARVDLERLGEQMQATLEAAKANDPTELRRKLAAITAERDSLQKAVPAVKETIKIIKVSVIADVQLSRMEKLFDRMVKEAERHGSAMAVFWGNQNELATALLGAIKATAVAQTAPKPLPIALIPRSMPKAVTSQEPSGDTGITNPQRRILTALATLHSAGIASPARASVAAYCGVKHTTGNYGNNLGRLKSLGLIDYPSIGTMQITDAGRAQVPEVPASVALAEYHHRWLGVLSGPQAKMLGVLLEKYPNAISRQELAEAVGVLHTTGNYGNNLGAMRTLGCIDYPARGSVKAADLMYPAGLI